jgi:hypothetical protein
MLAKKTQGFLGDLKILPLQNIKIYAIPCLLKVLPRIKKYG